MKFFASPSNINKDTTGDCIIALTNIYIFTFQKRLIWMHLYKRILFVFLSFTFSVSYSQNNCGVKAVINPGNDSVVYTNTAVYFTSASINATSYQFIISGGAYPLNQPVNTNFAVGLTEVKLVAFNGACTDTAVCYYFYPGTFPADRDNTKAYYGLPKINQTVSGFTSVSSGGYFIAGFRNNNSYFGLPDRAYIIKTKETGCMEWSRMFDAPNGTTVDVGEGADGSLVVTGAAGFGNGFIADFDLQGNLVWSKKIPGPGGTSFFAYGMQAVTGGMIFTGNFLGLSRLEVIRTDNAGNIIWQKEYDQNNTNVPAMRNILQKGNDLYIGGFMNYGQANAVASILMKLDFASGQTRWVKQYTSSAGQILLRDIHDNGAGLVVNASTGGGAGNYNISTLVKMDTSGNATGASVISETQEYYPSSSKIISLPGNKYYVFSYGTQPLALQPGISYQTKLAKLDASFNVLWARHYAAINYGQFYYPAQSPDHTLVIAGTENAGGFDYWAFSSKIMVKKIDSLGGNSNSCGFANWNMTSTPISVIAQPFSWSTDSLLTSVSQPFAVGSFPVYPEMKYSCPDYVDSCSLLKLSGPRSLCNLSTLYTYKVHKNKGCGQPTEWNIGAGITIVSQTDTAVTVRFNSFGTFKIAAAMSFGCAPLRDSIIVTAVSSTPPLNLGPDTALCPGNSIILHAGKKFLSYVWQDGSTDSTLTASGPGLYWVQVTDSCSNTLRDSVVITLRTSVPINIGPDRTKCNSDTIHLTAAPGFLNYNWAPNYNISSTTVQAVIVNPAVDTFYTLKAEKTPGCFAYDTVHISVFYSPAIDLGPDKNFCNGDSLQLNAGSGFAQYLWNNGSTSQNIFVHAPGNYSVIGTTARGCKSFDTLRVMQVYPLPVISLGNDSTLCTGTSRVLDAGPGKSYVWNTGDTSKTIVVNHIGIYAITVTDINGCKGSDSVRITLLLPVPSGFLPPDTAICSYGNVTLKTSVAYDQYTWSTGEISPSITITQPGLYWLQVKDRNNCTGKDSILINPKQCLAGFFIPTAFTPNRDNKNDIFRPLIFGNIRQYKFVVYDKWGQVIFQSNVPLQGWDGTIKGAEQNTNIFTWICTYQLEGEPVKTEKGFVTLLR